MSRVRRLTWRHPNQPRPPQPHSRATHPRPPHPDRLLEGTAPTMDLVRSWCAGAAVWVAWAAASALLHLWLLPLGALAVPHVRLLWIAATTLTGYTLVTLASGLAARPRRVRSREWAAVLPLPVLGAAVEVVALTRNGPDLPALLVALPALALGTAAGHRLTRPGKR